jgi:peptidoglycan/xylan/chitin deacetylase (PgdA/CDA1 family)
MVRLRNKFLTSIIIFFAITAILGAVFLAGCAASKYTITYDSNEGTGTISKGTTDDNKSIILSDGKGIAREGYILSSWNTAANGTGTSFELGSAQTFNEDITFYAKWKVIENTVGNTNGNTINGGSAALQGNWIYYVNNSDSYKLYKIKTDGTGKIKLSDDMPKYINVLGDWIYYSNDSDAGKLYKIKTDGTGKAMLSEDDVYYVNAAGDWIYYKNNSDASRLYKIKIDGTGKTKINDDMSYDITSAGEWIYYVDESNGYKIYKIKTDGTSKTKLNDNTSYDMNVADGWIYYQKSIMNSDDNSVPIGLYKIKTDGTEETKLSDDVPYYINVAGDWIYYVNNSDSNKLYKIKTDGSAKTKMCDDKSSDINVLGNWIYCAIKEDAAKLYKLKADGTISSEIINDDSSKGQGVQVASEGTAKLIFTFDDGWLGTFNYAAPILAKYNFKGTAYVYKQAVTEEWDDSMSLNQLNQLYNKYGWDISNHTVTHLDSGDTANPVQIAALVKEYKANQDWLVKNWPRGAYNIAYPYGKYSSELVADLKTIGAKTGRTFNELNYSAGLQAMSDINFFSLQGQTVERGNVDEIKRYIDKAVNTGKTGILVIHIIDPKGGPYTITPSDLEEITAYASQYVNSSKLEVLTMSEWYNLSK